MDDRSTGLRKRTQMKLLSMRVIFVAVLLACILLLARGLTAEASVEFYISPTGDDHNSGTKEKLFFGLTRAREVVRKRTKTGQGLTLSCFFEEGQQEI